MEQERDRIPYLPTPDELRKAKLRIRIDDIKKKRKSKAEYKSDGSYQKPTVETFSARKRGVVDV